MTIEAPYGAKYTVYYALRKEGGVKNELIAKDMADIIEYLCKAHRCKEDAIRVSDTEHTERKGS